MAQGNAKFISPIIDDTNKSTRTTYSSETIEKLLNSTGSSTIVYLKTIADVSPTTYSIKVIYYNTSTKLLYKAKSSTQWDTGYEPSSAVLYIDQEHNSIYTYSHGNMQACTATIDSVNLKKENILPTPFVIPATMGDLSISFATTLSKNIENYDWAEMRCVWTTSSGVKYYHNHSIETRTNGKSQWISQYWSGGENGVEVNSNNGIVFGVQGKNLDIKFTDLRDGTITITEIIGYKMTEVTDGTPFAHSHINNSVLDLLTSDDNQVLKFNNKPINAETYKKTLWQGSVKRTDTSGPTTFNTRIDPDESCLNYDATIFYFRLGGDGIYGDYEHTDINYIVEKEKDLWFSKTYNPTTYMCGNYTINSAGNIIISNFYQKGFTFVELYKIEGIKYGKI